MSDQGESVVSQEALTEAVSDLHICGSCKGQFHDIDSFILHKREACITNHGSRGMDIATNNNNLNNEMTQFSNENPTENAYVSNIDDGKTQESEAHTEVTTVEQQLGTELSFGDCVAVDGQCTAAEEVVLVEVPPDNVGTLTQELDGGNGVISLQSALMSSQTSQAAVINQSDGSNQTPDSAVQMVQRLLSSPHMTTHKVEDYNTAQSVLQVLQGRVTDTGPTSSHTTQLDTQPPEVTVKIKTLKKKFTCDQEECGFTTAYQKDLERHRRIHTGERPFPCHICHKSFNRADKLKVHIRSHAGKKPYHCNLCNYATSDSSSLKKHLRIHTDERPFKCQICEYASRNSSQLIVHLRTHTGDAPFQCQHCSAKFKINSDLKRHARLHTGEKPYRCMHCDYRCAIKGNLKTHVRINHSTDRVLICDQCEFTTSSPRALREHVKSHDTYEMTYKCPVCRYTCASRTTLRVHLRIHSNDRPYKCRFCPFTSKQSGNVGTHMRRKHWDMLRGGVVGKIIKGNSEGIQGNNKNKSNTIKLKPVVKKPFKCTKCEASFVRQDSLRSHVRHHKEVERDLAKKLESTVQAVLQLSTPVSLDANRTPSEQELKDSEVQIISETIQNVESLSSVGEVVHEVVTTPPVQVVATTLENNPTSSLTISASPVTGRPSATTAPHPKPHSPKPTPRPNHSYNQVLSNRLAFAQNNQNQAIEENYQNTIIGRQRIAEDTAAAAATSSVSSASSSIVSSPNVSNKTVQKQTGTSVNPSEAKVSNGIVPITGQSRIVRVMGQSNGMPVKVIQAVSMPSVIKPFAPKTIRSQSKQQVQSVSQKTIKQQQNQQYYQQQIQQPQQQQVNIVAATHQQSGIPQENNTVSVSQPIFQNQLATVGSTTQKTVQYQVSQQQNQKPMQVTLQVQQPLKNSVCSLTPTTVSSSSLQLVSSQTGVQQQVISIPTLVSIQQAQGQLQQQQQQQLQQIAGTPLNLQILQNGSTGSSLVPQQVQVLVPATALTQSSNNISQQGTYQQQVQVQVSGGTEGLLDSTNQYQFPLPVRLLPSQQHLILQEPKDTADGEANTQQLKQSLQSVKQPIQLQAHMSQTTTDLYNLKKTA